MFRILFVLLFALVALGLTTAEASAGSSGGSHQVALLALSHPSKNPTVDDSDFDDFGDSSAELSTQNEGPTIHDPFEKVNRWFFTFTFWVDDHIVAPIDMVYLDVTPVFMRTAFHNINVNLSEPFSAVNHLLQIKPVSTLETIARFLLNTTLGFFGTVDVASTLGLRPNRNDFAYTLSYYHIGEGFYIFVPLLGPYSVTTGINGLLVSTLMSRVSPLITTTFSVTKGLDYLSARPAMQSFIKGNNDAYSVIRYAYFQNRQYYAKQLKSTW